MSTDGEQTPGPGRASAGTWVMRNLVILVGAFLPSLILVVMTLQCVGARPDERCGADILVLALLSWPFHVVPSLLIGGVHVAVVLGVATRDPRVARCLALLTPAVLFVSWLRSGLPHWDLPAMALCALYHAFMLRLSPHQRLGDAKWVWAVPPALALAIGVLAAVGIV